MVIKDIDNGRDLRKAYDELNFLCRVYEGLSGLYEYDELATMRNLITRQKAAIREYNHRPTPEYPLCIRCDSDSCMLLDKLPDSIGTEAEARAHFVRNFYIPRPCYAYDCTGQAFTTRYKVFQRRGAWYVYHFMARDV